MASIQKRKYGYSIVVLKGRDADGKKITENTFFKADPHKTEKQNLKAVEKFAREFEDQVKNGICLDGRKLTLNELADRWIKECVEPQKQATTTQNYKMNLEQRILPALGFMKLTDIKPLTIQSFYRKCLESSRNDHREGTISRGTLKKIHAILSSMLHQAVFWQLIPVNPCDNVQLPSIEHNKKLKFFTPEETEIFLDLLDNSNTSSQIKLFIYLALFTGCRRGELMALCWTDINFDSEEIDINKSSALVNHEQIIKSTKTENSNRIISVPTSIMEMIKKHYTEQKKSALMMGTSWEGYQGRQFNKNFLFTQDNGKQMYITTPYTAFKRLIERYNKQNPENPLPSIPLHGLRHTSATLMFSRNSDVKSVAARLGHSQTSTTMNIYVHALKKADKEIAETFDDILKQRAK